MESVSEQVREAMIWEIVDWLRQAADTSKTEKRRAEAKGMAGGMLATIKHLYGIETVREVRAESMKRAGLTGWWV